MIMAISGVRLFPRALSTDAKMLISRNLPECQAENNPQADTIRRHSDDIVQGVFEKLAGSIWLQAG